METKRKTNKRKRKATKSIVRLGIPSNTYKAYKFVSDELYTVLRDIQKSYGDCIMIEYFPKTKDIAILWRHWSFVNPIRHAPRMYIGGRYTRPTIETSYTNTYYLWLD